MNQPKMPPFKKIDSYKGFKEEVQAIIKAISKRRR
jgi:hypothetical protein